MNARGLYGRYTDYIGLKYPNSGEPVMLWLIGICYELYLPLKWLLRETVGTVGSWGLLAGMKVWSLGSFVYILRAGFGPRVQVLGYKEASPRYNAIFLCYLQFCQLGL